MLLYKELKEKEESKEYLLLLYKLGQDMFSNLNFFTQLLAILLPFSAAVLLGYWGLLRFSQTFFQRAVR